MRYFYILFILISLTVIANIIGLKQVSAQSAQLFTVNKKLHFNLPIDCKIGEDCWVMNYVDMGANDDKKTDPACYSRTYDTHKGTDFGVLDAQSMKKGVHVIAPLDGTVKKIRDGAADRWSTPEELEKIKANRKECGNALLLDHGKGVETIYCHLKNGSITVKPGQKVKTGDKIAEVGLSGLTEFPHLHFGILKDKAAIDPFTGQDNNGTCAKRVTSLWHPDINLQYKPITIQSAGFSNAVPELSKIERNASSPDTIAINSKAFTFWTVLWGVRKNDKIILEITDPNGKIFAENKIIQNKTRAQQFYFIGKKTDKKKLKEGAYTGVIKIERTLKNGKTINLDKVNSILVTR